jgi:glutamyl/glutaminyl-tRNA synthetase
VYSLPLYRGRLAPSPTGWLHLGHARTFWTAQERARSRNGELILRMEDLDYARCKPEYSEGALKDLAWFGIDWQEGPDKGGTDGPYCQSQRLLLYQSAFSRLQALDLVYPCFCSRQDILRAASAPHAHDEEEPIYPGTCRPNSTNHLKVPPVPRAGVNWRFKIRDSVELRFLDHAKGLQTAVAGKDFGDFVIWRKEDLPSYQLACVVDDAAMGITEVVRGEDLIRSTFRQILLYRALGLGEPSFYHCPLMTDTAGMRLAKREDSLSLRTLRESGHSPDSLRATWNSTSPPLPPTQSQFSGD